MAGTVLWTGEGISLAIGTQVLLDDAKISIHAGERVALVGRNGSGKSTFMRIVAGTEQPAAGEIRELLIDENNPNHFFDIDRMKEKSIISYIAPVIVIALGIYLIVA